MRNLTNDLNLTSKLEYEMQPIHKAQENAVAIAKQAAVDFINMDVDAPYRVEDQAGVRRLPGLCG